jgi:hypothetical protein
MTETTCPICKRDDGHAVRCPKYVITQEDQLCVTCEHYELCGGGEGACNWLLKHVPLFLRGIGGVSWGHNIGVEGLVAMPMDAERCPCWSKHHNFEDRMYLRERFRPTDGSSMDV